MDSSALDELNRLHAVTRSSGRIPVLYGERLRGIHMSYIADGSETTAPYFHAGDAVTAWNLGAVFPMPPP